MNSVDSVSAIGGWVLVLVLGTLLCQRRKERKRVGGGVCGGWGGEMGWDKRAFVCDVNPFLSPLHTNNKKPA